MKKTLKYLIAIILSIFTVACMCSALSACKKGGGEDGSNTDSENIGSLYGKWDEYDGVKVAFADEATYNDGDIKENRVLPELNCKLGEKQYIIIDFDIQAPYDNDGRETVTADLKIQPAAAVKATIQETNSGIVSKETKDDITELKANYKIPEKADSVRNIRLVIQLEALQGSEVYIDASFESDGEIQAVKTEKVNKTAAFDFTQGLKYNGNTITGISDNEVEDVVIPVMLDKKYITSIDSMALYDCSRLISIIIPSSVTSIDASLFSECCKLEYITVDENNRFFASHDGILYDKANFEILSIPILINGKVDILDGVKRIGNYAFKDCVSLTEITIPNSVMSIGYDSFSGCNKLSRITLPFIGLNREDTTNTHLGFLFGAVDYYNNQSYVPSSLNKVELTDCGTIGHHTFISCYSLKSITIPDSVTRIGDYAFSGCSGLESITIPDSVTNIGKNAFVNCIGLTSVTIPNSVTSIGGGAFSGCIGLTSITIPNSVTRIGDYAFSSCSGLENITVKVDNKVYKSENNCLLTKDGKNLVLGCKTSIIPDSVTEIKGWAFSGCSKLISITIPDSVTKIGDGAFNGCSSLKSIDISSSVTIIENYVFDGCKDSFNINFNGIKAQWQAITKYSRWNSNTGNYTVHCTDGDLTKAES